MDERGVDAVVVGLNVTGLGILQTLGPRGVRLFGIDTDVTEIGYFSRYGKKKVVSDVVQWLIEFGSKARSRLVLFPTSDEYVLLLSKNRDRLDKYYYFTFPNNDVVEAVTNKYLFYQMVSRYMADVPKCAVLTKEGIETWDRWPAIIKPIYIHEFKKFFPGLKVFVVQSRVEAVERLQVLSVAGIEAVLQEIVTGPDDEQFSVSVYMDAESRVRASWIARKVRQSPPNFGVGTLVEGRDDPGLLLQSVKLLQAIGYTGIGEIEYRRDAENGRLKIIEINPRAWTQNKLAAYAGADIMGAAYSDCTGKKLCALPVIGKRWCFLLRDLETSWRYYTQRRIGLLQWLTPYPQRGTVWAMWSCMDPLPALVAPLYAIAKIARWRRTAAIQVGPGDGG